MENVSHKEQKVHNIAMELLVGAMKGGWLTQVSKAVMFSDDASVEQAVALNTIRENYQAFLKTANEIYDVESEFANRPRCKQQNKESIE